MKRRRVFISLTGEFPNLGDMVIRRQVLEWSRPPGDVVTACVGDAPESWSSSLNFDAGDRVFSGRRARLHWLRALLFSRARPDVVLEPGEISLSRWHFPLQFVLLVMTVLVRLRGGRVMLPPRAVTRRQEAAPWAPTVMLHKVACRLSSVVLWRDPWSVELIGCGALVPDIGLAATPRPGLGSARRYLAVSLRSRPPMPGAEWTRGLRAFAESEGLEVVAFAQVETDEARAADLAAALGGTLMPWSDEGWRAHEAALYRLYERTRLVVSDRMHVLLLASLRGATPFELVPSPSGKVAIHFGAIGVQGVSVDSAGCSADAVVQHLSHALAQGESHALRVLEASKALESVRLRWRGTLELAEHDD